MGQTDGCTHLEKMFACSLNQKLQFRSKKSPYCKKKKSCEKSLFWVRRWVSNSPGSSCCTQGQIQLQHNNRIQHPAPLKRKTEESALREPTHPSHTKTSILVLTIVSLLKICLPFLFIVTTAQIYQDCGRETMSEPQSLSDQCDHSLILRLST